MRGCGPNCANQKENCQKCQTQFFHAISPYNRCISKANAKIRMANKRAQTMMAAIMISPPTNQSPNPNIAGQDGSTRAGRKEQITETGVLHRKVWVCYPCPYHCFSFFVRPGASQSLTWASLHLVRFLEIPVWPKILIPPNLSHPNHCNCIGDGLHSLKPICLCWTDIRLLCLCESGDLS